LRTPPDRARRWRPARPLGRARHGTRRGPGRRSWPGDPCRPPRRPRFRSSEVARLARLAGIAESLSRLP